MASTRKLDQETLDLKWRPRRVAPAAAAPHRSAMPPRRAPLPPPPPRGAAVAAMAEHVSGAGAGDAHADEEDPFLKSLPATVHVANKEGRAKLVQEVHAHAKANGKARR